MTRRCSGLVAAMMLWSGVGACSRGDFADSGPPQLDTLESGRIVVRNTRLGTWTPETRWSLVEDLRLGSLDEAGPEQFGRVDGIVADPLGRIYVLDGLASEVRAFEADGSFLYTVGGPGEGPSEFGDVLAMSIAPAGHLWVVDAGNHRYSAFDREGDLVATYPRTVVSSASMAPGFIPGGGFLEWSTLEGRADDTRRWVPVRFQQPEHFDTLATVEYRFTTVGGGLVMTAWDASLTGTLGSDRTVWFAPMDGYTVHQRSLDGDTLLTVSRPAAPMPVTPAERDSVVEFFSQFNVDLDPSELPRDKLIIRVMVHDRTEYLYVFPQERGVPQGSVVDVFEDAGVYLGRMILPEEIDLGPGLLSPHVTREYLYVRVRGASGVHFVSRLRIERPASQ